MGQHARTKLISIKPGDRVVPHKEAAAYLGITPKALYHLCYRGEGPKHCVRVSGRRRGYLFSELGELVEKNMEREAD